MLGCSQVSPNNPPDPSVRLAAIPAADEAKYKKISDMKNWQNPFLIVHTDNIGLFDPANNVEHLLKPNEILPALADLPPSAWPYGRVVAVEEQSRSSAEQDRIAIRRNRGILAGTLADAKLAVTWVPST